MVRSKVILAWLVVLVGALAIGLSGACSTSPSQSQQSRSQPSITWEVTSGYWGQFKCPTSFITDYPL
jgi:hypothetical protein